MGSDSSAREQRPTFWWQAALILLPVALLAAVGFFSLRQDRALAQQEAVERAKALAEEFVPKLWGELIASTNRLHHAFQVDDAGHLLYPPPVADVPGPRPLGPSDLSSEQNRLWQDAQRAEASEPPAALRAWRDFNSAHPPGKFAGVTHYALGVWLAKTGSAAEAAREFGSVLESYPEAVGESGLPLEPLAQLRLLELETGSPPAETLKVSARVEALCSNAVLRPTLLTPQLLKGAAQRATSVEAKRAVQKWQDAWAKHQLSRELFAGANSLLAPPSGAEARLLLLETELRGTTAPGAPATDSPSARVLPDLFWFSTESAWVHSLTNQTPGAGLALTVEDRNWLALRTSTAATNYQVVCLAESEVGQLASALVNSDMHVPDDFGIGVALAGKKLTWFAPDLRVWHVTHYVGGKGAGQEKKEFLEAQASEVLASAAKVQNGQPLLQAQVYLTSPATLFQRQRTRSFWFGALIAAAAVAALSGLFAAYRSFRRQLRLSELKSNFVSSVSHELRAPIASVRLLAESLERGKIVEAPKQQQYFRFIVQECRRLSSLIENVLNFSRIEQGRKEYEFEPTDLVALVRQTVNLMQTYADERQVTLELALDSEPASTNPHQLSVDGKALQQALINLIDNALKHSPKGETVRVGLETPNFKFQIPNSKRQTPDSSGPPCSALGAGIELWVEDDGPGIPPGEHEKIFERFYRLGSELRRETPGVGIGLSIVEHIVEAHGGRVRVRSDVGQGSRFTIVLPIPADATESKPGN